jgi:hypothetical protein
MNNSTIQKVFDHHQLVIAFEDYDDQNLDTLILPLLANSYSPNVCGSSNLIRPLPPDPTSIINYDPCVRTPPQTPYFDQPVSNSIFPRRQRSHNPPISEPEYTSLLPLLINAHRNNVEIHQYDIISERNSFMKISRNKEDYVLSVMKFGSTLFLRRHHDDGIRENDVGRRFERMCTPGYHLTASYNQLIEGHMGNLRTLIIAETDAVSRENGKAIELKCRSNQGIRQRRDCWLQTFFGKINNLDQEK